MVYLREAHPVSDETAATPTNKTAGILVKQPTSLEERNAVAQRCSKALHLEMPMVVDEINNRIGRTYFASPDRLYIVDRDGRIAYRGGPGPFGFNPYEMEQSLTLMLLEQERAVGKEKRAQSK